MKKILKIFFSTVIVIIIVIIIVLYFVFGRNFQIKENPLFGVTFSKRQAEALGLNWQENYLSLLDDLKVKIIRLPVYWDEVEPQMKEFYFTDLDWQIKQAEERGVDIVLVVGRKLPRWPECFAPNWLEELSDSAQKTKTLLMLAKVVKHFQGYENIKYWQLENEPFFPYGECPKRDKRFFDEELKLLRFLDKRPILITDSGEWSLWWGISKRADIVGSTLYRVVWNKFPGYFKYPIPPIYYQIRANIVKYLFNKDKFIISELQAEPWGPKLIHELSYEEQMKSMNIKQFLENVEYARQVGFSEIYLWGSEWWYWLKTKRGDNTIWQAAKLIFAQQNID